MKTFFFHFFFLPDFRKIFYYFPIIVGIVLTNMDLIMAKTHMAIYLVFLYEYFFINIIGLIYNFPSIIIILYHCTYKLDF